MRALQPLSERLALWGFSALAGNIQRLLVPQPRRSEARATIAVHITEQSLKRAACLICIAFIPKGTEDDASSFVCGADCFWHALAAARRADL